MPRWYVWAMTLALAAWILWLSWALAYACMFRWLMATITALRHPLITENQKSIVYFQMIAGVLLPFSVWCASSLRGVLGWSASSVGAATLLLLTWPLMIGAVIGLIRVYRAWDVWPEPLDQQFYSR